MVLVSPTLVLDPAEKKASSDPPPPLPLPLKLVLLLLATLGGGLTHTSLPSIAPLPTVTGPAPPTPIPAPPLVRFIAELNSSSKSVKLVVRLNELLRLGAITLGSPG